MVILKDRLWEICKEMAMVYFKTLSQHLSRSVEETYMKYQYTSPCRQSNMGLLDKKPRNYIEIFTIH
jgi:hypothetical protein